MKLSEEAIFNEALSLQNPTERDAYLAVVCGNDAHLRRRVEELIEAYDRGDFLEGPLEGIAEVTAPADGTSLVGSQISGYAILDLIGLGGMGDVYLAQSMNGVPTSVALKVIKPGMDSRQVIARFEMERRALGRMDHPHIAQFLDAGLTEQGRAYFAMELVKGLPITEYCDRHQLPITHRLKLLVDLCLAVQHAHNNGVIHRDLKPTNVLVTEVDSTPVVKVIDFGVAKALDTDLSERTLFTWAFQILGTPLYMSPEQATWSTNVDARADVYAIGCLLYELLTGTTPIEASTLHQLSLDELRRIIQEHEPLRPSARMATCSETVQSALAAVRSSSSKELRLQLRGDLDWITLQALAKDVNQRYATAGEIAEDLDRYLTHRPVRAMPPRWSTRVRKWSRRHPKAIRLVAACILVSATIAGGFWVLGAVRQARVEADIAAANKLRESRRQEYVSDMESASLSIVRSEPDRVQAFLSKHAPPPNQLALAGFEWQYLHGTNVVPLQICDDTKRSLLSADVSPDQKWIVAGDRNGLVTVHELASRHPARIIDVGGQEVTSVKFSPNGHWLAIAGVDRKIHLIKTAAWTQALELERHTSTVSGLAWSPDSKWLASSGRDGVVNVWDVAAARLHKTLDGDTDVVRFVTWSPDGSLLAGGCGHGLNLWETSTWQHRRKLVGEGLGALCAAFSPGGRHIAFGGYDSVLTVADVESGQGQSIAMAKQIWSLAFLRDDRVVAGLGSGLAQVVQWDGDNRRTTPLWIIDIQGGGALRSAIPLNDAERFVFASEGGFLQVFGGAGLLRYQIHTHDGPSLGVAQQTLFVSDRANDVVLVKDPFRESPLAKLSIPPEWNCQPVASEVSGLVAIADADSQVYLCRPGKWQVEKRFHVLSSPRTMSFSKDGRFLAGGCADGRVWIKDLESDRYKDLDYKFGPWHADVAFSPTEEVLMVAACGEKTLTAFSVPDFKLLQSAETTTTIKVLKFHPDGMRLAVGQDQRISVWDIHPLHTLLTMHGHEGDVHALAFSPQGQTLASAGLDGVRLWDIDTGREFFSLHFKPPRPDWVHFLDAATLLVGSWDSNEVYQYGAPPRGSD